MKPNITERHFPDKLPIGVSPDGRRHAFLYLLVNPLPQDFQVFLRRHAELLRALPAWSIQLLVPVEQTDKDRRAQRLAELYESAFRQELATPLDPVTANELRWFWEASTLGTGVAEGEADATGAALFGTPRFRALRRALQRMDTAPSTSPRRVKACPTRLTARRVGLNVMTFVASTFCLSRAIGTA